jgi:hypothetical protein
LILYKQLFAYHCKIICFLKQLFVIFLLSLLFSVTAVAQPTQFSMATDLSLLRSLKEGQRYWAIGQTINANFHFFPKDGAYAWLSYYGQGKFSNVVTASAKGSATSPQQITYVNTAGLDIKEISLGWKHFFKGTFDSERTWNLYGYAGFGLMFGRITNTQVPIIDTTTYVAPVLGGRGYFKRLTLDLGLGVEFALGADVYLYTEGRTLVPTTDYPSPYLFVNEKAPFTVAMNLGLRILFH